MNRTAGSAGAWRSVIGCMLVMMSSSGAMMAGLCVVIPSWVAEFGIGSGEAMLSLAGISIIAGVIAMTVGSLLGRFSARLLLLVGVATIALALFVSSFATSFAMLLLTLVPVAAIGNALNGPVIALNFAVRSFEKPGLPMATAGMGMNFGAIIGPPILAMLLIEYGWQAALRIAAVFVLIVGSSLILGLIGKMPDTRQSGDRKIDAAPDVSAGAGRIIRSPAFIGTVLFHFPLWCLMAGVYYHLPLMMLELNGSLTMAANFMALAAVTELLGTLISGWLVDHLPESVLLTLAMTIMLGTHLLLVSSPTITMLMIVPIAFSTGISIIFPLVPAILSRRFEPATFPKAISLFQPFHYGGVLGALLLGLVHDRFGNYPSALLILLVLPVISLTGIVLLICTRNAPAIAGVTVTSVASPAS